MAKTVAPDTVAHGTATQVEESSGILAGLLPDVAAAVQRALVAAQEASTGQTRAILGVPDGAKAAVVAALARLVDGPVVVISARPNHSATLFDDVQAWLSDDVERLLLRFPPRETVPYEHRSHDRAAAHERLTVLTALAGGADPLILTDIQALGQRTSRPAGVLPELRVGGRLNLDEFILALDAAGYRQASVVDEPGTFARRGGIMDVFPSTQDVPLRIELFGDEIDSLRRFDPRSQRSIETVQVASIDAATEAAFGQTGMA